MTRRVATMLFLASLSGVAWAAAPPDPETLARATRIREAEELNVRAQGLYQQGKVTEATGLLAEVLRRRETLYPKSRFPQGHLEIADTLSGLGFLYQTLGNHAKAEVVYERSLRMTEALYPATRYPKGHPEIAGNLNNLAGLYQTLGEYLKAEPLYRRALKMNEDLYPRAGHPDMATSLNNLAVLYMAEGEYTKAEPLYKRALKMTEQLFPGQRYPRGHPDLANSLNNLAGLYRAQAEYMRAEPLYQRSLKMTEDLFPALRYPRGHLYISINLNNLAALYEAMGEFAKAERLFKRSLKMRESLYPPEKFPQGHPDLATGINNLAVLYRTQGEYARAEPLYERALKMTEALYPGSRFTRGHPEIAGSLNNLATLYEAQAKYAKAEPFLKRALTMNEQLYPVARYPQGHPDLAGSVNNLATLYQAMGDDAKAEPLLKRAVEMYEQLYLVKRYPIGHPSLANSLNGLAGLHDRKGELSKAASLYRRAMAMYLASVTGVAATAPEVQTLNYLSSLPLTRDGYLSVTQKLSETAAYAEVWQSKAAMSRVYERRHLAVLAASTEKARAQWDAAVSLRRQRERILLAPASAASRKARDEKLDELDGQIAARERDLLALLPQRKRDEVQAASSPGALQKKLGGNTALVDFLRYTLIRQDPNVPGKKGRSYTPRYVAFVITADRVTRMELGEAKPIEEAAQLWRAEITEGQDGRRHAAVLRRLVWEQVAKHLPAKTTAVYISPDAELTRLPWGALPGAKPDSVLLEEHAVAIVPHGPFLLDRLTNLQEKPQGKSTLLAIGGVAYDKEPATAIVGVAANRSPAGEGKLWPDLPGTGKEVSAIEKLARGRQVLKLQGDRVSQAAVLAGLTRAQHAHLATHGFFADAKFRSVLQLDEKLFEQSRFGERVGAGALNPLVLSGLVCAGANLKDTPQRGILTADAITGLDLRRLEVAVLSACETGLGETAGGEGVYGLTRAFHIAGTRNVVASLWKVPDEATAALMTLYYQGLWDEKNPQTPMEALRRAQLAIYSSPEHVKDWSAGRGPNLAKVIDGAGKPVEVRKPGGKRAPIRAWAAWVLSGPGD